MTLWVMTEKNKKNDDWDARIQELRVLDSKFNAQQERFTNAIIETDDEKKLARLQREESECFKNYLKKQDTILRR